MPERETIERAREDAREGKSPSTQAGEFVREEIHHVREGKHGARSPEQAIAIGLSKARRAGVHQPPPRGGKAQRKRARRDSAKSRRRRTPSRRPARAVRPALAHQRLIGAPEGQVFCVADGLGGHAAGETASSTAIDATAHYLLHTMPCFFRARNLCEQELRDELSAAVQRAQAAVERRAARD